MIEDLPRLLLLLLPGYVAVRFFQWASYSRNQSELEIVLWSLGAALALLVPLAGVWAKWRGGPTFADIVNAGALVPMTLNIAMLLGAVLLGTSVGLLDRHGGLDAVLRLVKIDLGRREDVWFTVFGRQRWVQVSTTDGRVYFGWPHHWSRDRQGPASELYLIQVKEKDRDSGSWESIDGVEGVWFDASGIARIMFLPVTPQQCGAIEHGLGGRTRWSQVLLRWRGRVS